MPLDEVSTALSNKRHELIVSGPSASKTIENEGLDDRVYECTSLNYLNINTTSLECLSSKIGSLTGLTNLVLCGNKLTSIPSEIGQLTKLKLVDLSRNSITHLPDEFGKLLNLHSFNASFNKLECMPDIDLLANVSVMDLSHNCFTSLPTFSSKLGHLSELNMSDNQITDILLTVVELPSIKIVDLCNNKIAAVPGEIADCAKLKELRLKGNALKDRRLLKLVDQCHYKQVMEYVRRNCARSSKEASSSKSKSKNKVKSQSDNDGKSSSSNIKVLHVSNDTPFIKCTEEVKSVRPFIVGCIVRNVNLENQDTFKKFIALQTKLHDSICEKRMSATIATHDLSKINGNLLYDAADPVKIMIQPLMRNKKISTAALYQQLRDEAESQRKEKKRNTFSGVHKYLYLLEHKTQYPFLSDESGNVISFPPITNSDLTKIADSTKSIFVEVSSSVSLPICKQVLDSLLNEMVGSDIGVEVAEDGSKNFVVEQVRICDSELNMKVVYPSRTDLKLASVNVIHG